MSRVGQVGPGDRLQSRLWTLSTRAVNVALPVDVAVLDAEDQVAADGIDDVTV
jgi:hypothetical protein